MSVCQTVFVAPEDETSENTSDNDMNNEEYILLKIYEGQIK